MKYTIAQFIPIILIFLFMTYFKGLVKYSNTILGKLLAVCIIIYYTSLDKILGVFICLLCVFFYQSDIVENMLNMDEDSFSFNNNYVTDNEITENNIGEHHEQIDFDDLMFLSNDDKKKNVIKEKMTNYVEYNSDDFNKDILLNNEKLQGDFRDKNCSNGELMNKDIKINYEMTEHVFPEIKFKRGFCNPCLNDCEFSIIEEKLNTENKLVRK
jgi:hypothetical protein